MLNKQKLVCAFLLLILTGVAFDTYNTINKYGWEYERTITIDGEDVTHMVYSMNSIVFSSIFGIFTALSFWVMWQIAHLP